MMLCSSVMKILDVALLFQVSLTFNLFEDVTIVSSSIDVRPNPSSSEWGELNRHELWETNDCSLHKACAIICGIVMVWYLKTSNIRERCHVPLTFKVLLKLLPCLCPEVLC